MVDICGVTFTMCLCIVVVLLHLPCDDVYLWCYIYDVMVDICGVTFTM